LQKLAETALSLCRAQSAGVSLLDETRKNFYWPAVAGQWACYLGAGTPRDFGPCGTVLDRDVPLLFSHPERLFTCLAEVKPYLEEGLLFPFHVDGQAVGTIWVVNHDHGRQFGAEDMRVLGDLAAFAAAAYQSFLASTKVRESERRLRQIIDALPAAIYTTDADGRVTMFNEAAATFAGRTPQLGTDSWCVTWRLFWPDGTPMPHDQCPMATALKEQRKICGMEGIVERPDGTRRHFIPYPTPLFDSSGTMFGAVNMAVDITDHKKAELALAERNIQLALAGKAALVGSYAYDIVTEIMQISPGYAAIHGFPEGTTEIRRSECLASVHSDDIERVEQFRSEAFRECRCEYNVEYRIIRAGEVRWVETRCFISYNGEGRPHRVVGVSIDITARKRAEEQQRALHAELDHRVKNVLATVNAIATHTKDASSSMDDFVAALDSRIQSMASTHELLSSSRWEGVSLQRLVRRELAPYISNNNTCIAGSKAILRAEAAQTIASVLHELTTNAAKYGALSKPEGRVSVRWHFAPNGQEPGALAIEWRETGGPPVKVPSNSGYGRSVITDLVPYELGGKVHLAFSPEGVQCRLDIPAKWLAPPANKSKGKSGTALCCTKAINPYA
jgi:PAS domain S-box-containing protein